MKIALVRSIPLVQRVAAMNLQPRGVGEEIPVQTVGQDISLPQVRRIGVQMAPGQQLPPGAIEVSDDGQLDLGRISGGRFQ